MAHYLITDKKSDHVIAVVEAKSIRKALEKVDVSGKPVLVYTVTKGPRTVTLRTVTETRLIIGGEEE